MDRLRHHTIVAWQRADALFFELHRLIVQSFPRTERFELSSQLRRAALTVPANIAEGFARRLPGERAQFLRTAWASLVEADYYLSVGRRLEYFSAEEEQRIQQLVRQTAAALLGLIRSLH
jgi:four helix bundle protein